ncbi:CASP-like protein 4C1 [Phalaenopsis equestris]|uniref:CASP-like protein 4C1 n=1 Tax=Phalaenopsis equestris TaxID=78828 RepID=UPI0009E4A65A|nr:CASP-like protein 4C1 [Phalaenopsis equestris]
MPSPLRNGDLRSPAVVRHGQNPFQSTVTEQKLRRLNALILLLRFAAFCFSLAAAIFMASNSSRTPGSPSWLHYPSFRFVLAANSIVSVYCLFEMFASVWEILKGGTFLPESMQLWFDFSHDQMFAYMLLAAEATGTGVARDLHGDGACDAAGAFCVQAYISVGLGVGGFAFLALSALLSGFRVACYIITGSRFHL